MADGKDVLKAFAKCDGKFFQALKANADVFPGAPMKAAGDIAYLAVPDRKAKGQQEIKFATPIEVGPFHLTGYSDEPTVAGNITFVSWGFFAAEPPSVVGQAMRALSKVKLTSIKGTYVHDELYSQGHRRPLSAATGLSGIEHVLLIEPSDAKDIPGTRIGCSIQDVAGAAKKGEMDAILKDLRPDL